MSIQSPPGLRARMLNFTASSLQPLTCLYWCAVTLNCYLEASHMHPIHRRTHTALLGLPTRRSRGFWPSCAPCRAIPVAQWRGCTQRASLMTGGKGVPRLTCDADCIVVMII